MGTIAIDGPAGAGKSTIAKLVAKELGFVYVDTGAMFRCIAYNILESHIDPLDENAVANKLNDSLITVKYIEEQQHVYLDDVDVTGYIRSEAVGNCASKIAGYSSVREMLLKLQREVGSRQSVVMDGRDIGTVVLPNADLKIFLTASVEERTRRRVLELTNKGETPDPEKIKQDIIIRDKQDMERKIAPLKQAEDAVFLDSSEMTIDEVAAFITNLYRERV